MNRNRSDQKIKLFTVRNICIALAVIFSIGGIIALILAPRKSESPDQANLKQELKKNAAMLNQRARKPAPKNTVSADTDSSGKTDTAEKKDDIKSFTAIGDSVMLGASQQILKLYPDSVVDAKESRQLVQAVDIVNDLKKNGRLKQTVILALGLNGTFSKETGQSVLDEIGSDHQIYWVLPYGESVTYVGDVISTIRSLADSNKNLTLLDWPSVARKHPEWFYNDGIHLKPEGQAGYAKWLQKELQK